ncbi:hypothetical protein MES5069_190064 [Mesorhizobium escarrei]|uniref:Secreted protein n=1 Tax=Mesorhizobium escarrei TaxID=666018 RepID=A0ABM9DN82_9HYPH|nr:hypothetical protein MES5069_190064 [Mesorhizobium escarrei]
MKEVRTECVGAVRLAVHMHRIACTYQSLAIRLLFHRVAAASYCHSPRLMSEHHQKLSSAARFVGVCRHATQEATKARERKVTRSLLKRDTRCPHCEADPQARSSRRGSFSCASF